MYSMDKIASLTNYNHVMKLLNKHPDFDKRAYQITLKQGDTLNLSKNRNHSFIVKEGYIQFSNLQGDEEVFLSICQHGDFIYLPLIDGRFFDNLKLEALDSCVLWKIDFEVLKTSLLLEDPNNFVLLNFLENYCVDFYRRIVLSTADARSKVCYILDYLAKNFGIHQQNGSTLLPPFVSYEKLSFFTGLSRSRIIAVMKELTSENIVTLKKHKWVILKSDQLDRSLFFKEPYDNRIQ
ncbi:Crp/Fnr family transcriptional regulator [Listeria booriae]|uniref:Crp/Fnr family transcriptional regulator n=1 Tax=Listeria booriae TaxID=1552123 RepID=UPI00162620AB|nr:Crp/Fnr family transcriptional regulator [Listeria booriae]MBC2159879.1 Crp/Fnr family transcriptional regulator [Listeria booriae]MBC2164536.1 Crp/Fnr family transcriptional regulator [Listeria booriae]MBC2170538.1 Crp/Fnr family transcriptional regulator [Listeria booriae]MBC2174370.1 Crp/Fnr family transcriptional regulator [Listeria booriae]MBC2196492.1 Crp/Fnr family transcriptional regulator [Listeria booriae]